MSETTDFTRRLMCAAPLLNARVTAVANMPGLSRVVGRNVALISYTGRRSGRSYSIPVAYRRERLWNSAPGAGPPGPRA